MGPHRRNNLFTFVCLHLLFTEFVYISAVCLPDPQRSTRAKSLPVPKGTMAQGGFEQRESCPTLSKH